MAHNPPTDCGSGKGGDMALHAPWKRGGGALEAYVFRPRTALGGPIEQIEATEYFVEQMGTIVMRAHAMTQQYQDS